MTKKFNHRYMFPVWISCALGAGFILCLALDGLLEKSGWAEVVSALATVIALVLAVVTYRSWQLQKIREDAYSTTRLYISTLATIESTIIETLILLQSLIPQPGLVILNDEAAKKNLNALQENNNALSLYTLQLRSIKTELPFWGVSLSKKAEAEHDSLILSINSFRGPLHFIHGNLTNIYINKVDDDTSRWSSMLQEQWETLNKSFSDRKSMSVKSMFIF